MIHFAIVVGPERSCAGLLPHVERAVAATSPIGGDVEVVAGTAEAWCAAIVTAPDPLSGPRMLVRGDELVLCNGALGGEPSDVELEAVLGRYRRGGMAAAMRPLAGTFNLVCAAPGHGVAFGGDPASFYPLYFGSTATHTVVSNRSITVSRYLGLSGWNASALGWMISAGFVCGQEMPSAGAKGLRPGHAGRIRWGGHEVEVAPLAHPYFDATASRVVRGEIPDDEWDRIVDDLVEGVARLGKLDTPLFLPLSGGKDSRTVLSLMAAARLSGFPTFTSGDERSGEVSAAAAVAAAVGVPHSRGHPEGARVPARKEVEVRRRIEGGQAADLWRRLSEGIGRFDGIVASWAAVKTPSAPASLILKGWGGEIYRYKSRPLDRATMEAHVGAILADRGASPKLADAFTDRLDPLRLLTPAERDRQRDWMRQWVDRSLDEVRPDLLPDLFFVDHKLANFQGPVTQGLPLRLTAHPLVSRPAMAAYATLPLHLRTFDRFHYEVMRRAAPQIVDLPFYRQHWSPQLHAPVLQSRGTAGTGRQTLLDRRDELKERLYQDRARLRRLIRQRWLAGTRWSQARPGGFELEWRLVEEDPGRVDALLAEATDAGLAEVCRVDRLRRVVADRPQLDRSEEIQVTSAIGLALLLTDQADRVVETPTRAG